MCISRAPHTILVSIHDIVHLHSTEEWLRKGFRKRSINGHYHHHHRHHHHRHHHHHHHCHGLKASSWCYWVFEFYDIMLNLLRPGRLLQTNISCVGTSQEKINRLFEIIGIVKKKTSFFLVHQENMDWLYEIIGIVKKDEKNFDILRSPSIWWISQVMTSNWFLSLGFFWVSPIFLIKPRPNRAPHTIRKRL